MGEDAEARRAIEAVLARQSEAWEAGDADGFAEAALDGVSFTNVMGMHTLGAEPFKVQHARIFATIYRGTRMTQQVEDIAFVRPDVAIVNTLTSIEGDAHLPPGFAPGNGPPRARLQQVMVREGGAWKVAAFHNVFVNPAFQGPPPG